MNEEHNSQPDNQIKYLTAREHNHIAGEMMGPIIHQYTIFESVRDERDALLRERDVLLRELTRSIKLTKKQCEVLKALSAKNACAVFTKSRLWHISDEIQCRPLVIAALLHKKLVEQKRIEDWPGTSTTPVHWEVRITRRGLAALNKFEAVQ